jgi:PAS domain S-box-containing protein
MSVDTEYSALLRHSHYRSAFEQLLTSLSMRFINLPSDSIDQGILEALGKVGNYTEVDRCFVYQYTDDTERVAQLTHEWCAKGVKSLGDLVQRVDVQDLSWVVAKMHEGRVLHITDISQLPEEAASLRTLYEKLGIRAACYLPLFFRSGRTGMLGFSCVKRTKVWSDDSIALLRVMGELVVNAIDRKQSLKELEATKERYRSVVDDLTDYIVRWKPDGTMTYVNAPLCRYWNMTSEELLKINVFNVIHPDDVWQKKSLIESLTPENPFGTDVHRVNMLDGTSVWHEWSDRALFDADGNVVELQSVGRDITADMQAREELEYRQKLENLILHMATRFINIPSADLPEQIVDALRQVGEFVGGDRSYIYRVDLESNESSLAFQWLAPAAPDSPPGLRRMSTSGDDWGIPVLAAGHPISMSSLDELPPGSEELRKNIESIGIQSFIIVPAFSEGKLFAFMGISSRERGRKWSEETAGILRLLGEVFVNALKRQEAEVALATSQERLSLTIDAVADGFYDWNLASGKVFVSDNWLAVRHLEPGEQIWSVTGWQESIHPDDRAVVTEQLEEHLAGRSDVFECEYRVEMEDGSWRWNLDRGRVIERDAEGKPVRMVGVDRDITDEVLSRQRLADADARLAHLARVATMGEIVAGIAHEVNQPLHAAATFANATTLSLESRDQGFADRASTMVQKISAQINRAADIIRRLREFTRPQAVRMAQFDLNGLLRESAEMVGFEARRRCIRVEFNLDEFLPRVIGDRVQVQQVIVNLLRNAFDAFDAERLSKDRSPRVSLRTSQTCGGVRLDVSDNGSGIAEGVEIESLFDAFVTSKVEGMGMGLALSRTIVSRHHGKIWGESNSEGGMTFSVLLPVDRGENRD